MALTPVKRAAFTLVFALVAAGAALGAVEAYIRLKGSAQYGGDYRWDPSIGWRYAPSTEFIYRVPETPDPIRTRVHTTADGFRDLGPVPAGRRFKAAVHGDSFVSNLAVADNRVFTSLANAALFPGAAVKGPAGRSRPRG